MVTRILVPTDGSPQSEAALEYVLEEFPDGEITLINVVDPVETGYNAPMATPGYSEEWYEMATEDAEAMFEDAQQNADEYGVTLASEIETGRPARTIVEYAEENGFDQIVMGSHGRSGVSRILLGSVAETVVRRSPIPVTVVR